MKEIFIRILFFVLGQLSCLMAFFVGHLLQERRKELEALGGSDYDGPF